ncbi:MAG: hypothetical protein MZV70_37770 [Desulfobacterales bacterium]|nr:hypothetical protein [Desulfobacterales bacterium]
MIRAEKESVLQDAEQARRRLERMEAEAAAAGRARRRGAPWRSTGA